MIVDGLRDESAADLEVDRAAVGCGDVSGTLGAKRGGASGLSIAHRHGIAAAAREVVGCIAKRHRAFIHGRVGSYRRSERDRVVRAVVNDGLLFDDTEVVVEAATMTRVKLAVTLCGAVMVMLVEALVEFATLPVQLVKV